MTCHPEVGCKWGACRQVLRVITPTNTHRLQPLRRPDFSTPFSSWLTIHLELLNDHRKPWQLVKLKSQIIQMAEAFKTGVGNVRDALHLNSSNEQGAAPVEPSADEIKSLKEKYGKAKQDHVFTFYDQLSVPEKASLYNQLSLFDTDRINCLADDALHPTNRAEEKGTSSKPSIEPLPDSAVASILDSNPEDVKKWWQSGLEQIADNKVAVVLMAGGQGTRLGSSAPKGCFDIGLPSQKSLFQLQAERIWTVQRLAQEQFKKTGVVVPWYVMTSGPTRGPTEKFFEEHNHFGLAKENVYIFEQGVLPCISNDGKILMESKSKVSNWAVCCRHKIKGFD
jgi:UDP-N-acetylglucosamine/UDP-N-acetylgalactosamine diphosphorylase